MDENKLKWFFNSIEKKKSILTSPFKPAFIYLSNPYFQLFSSLLQLQQIRECVLSRNCIVHVSNLRMHLPKHFYLRGPAMGFLIHWIKESRFYLLCWTLEMTTLIQWAHCIWAREWTHSRVPSFIFAKECCIKMLLWLFNLSLINAPIHRRNAMHERSLDREIKSRNEEESLSAIGNFHCPPTQSAKCNSQMII